MRSPRARTASRPPRAPERSPRRQRHPPATQTFFAASRPSPTGSSTGTRLSFSATSRPSSRIGDRLLVALGRVGHPVVPERVVEHHDAAGTQQPQRLVEVGGVLGLVAVAEHQVVVTVGEPGEHVERGTGDGAGPLGGDAGLGEGLLREALVLGLDVDGGQHAVGAHAAQQPEPRRRRCRCRSRRRRARRARRRGSAARLRRRSRSGRRRPPRRGRGRRRGPRPRRRTPRRRTSSRA